MAINTESTINTFRYPNETYSGCDMTATININMKTYDSESKQIVNNSYHRVLGELTTISYSIYMEKKPVRSISNVNAKDYVMGQRTIAGSLVFNVFNKHFAQDIMENINKNFTAGTSFLVDELPPFDITISAANEYGYRSRMAIYGVRLLNEGQVMSINDVYTENTYQFFATDVEYFTDEMSYYRDNTNKMYILKDNLETHKATSNLLNIHNELESHKLKTTLINGPGSLWTREQQEYYEKYLDREPFLQVDIKQPTKYNKNGIVTFSIEPAQDEGKVVITNLKTNKISYCDLQASFINRTRILSTSIEPGKYSAYFINSRNNNVTNTIVFNVKEYIEFDPLTLYAPTIENVTDTTISIYVNEPSHNRIHISTEPNDNTIDLDNDPIFYNRRYVITELNKDTTYYIVSYNTEDRIITRAAKVTTLKSKDKIFKQLELYCMANSKKLIFHDMIIYNKLLKEAQLIAENNDLNTSDSLIKLKEDYVSQYSAADKEKQNEIDLKIKAINELIIFSCKLFSNYIKAVNEQVVVPMPSMLLNDKYENIFIFDKSITSAEFFTITGNSVQFCKEVFSYNFTTIDGVDNCIRFTNKPGRKHYVIAKIDNHRSAKYEFYVMTQKEIEEKIKGKLEDSGLTDKDKEQIDNTITNDKINIKNQQDYEKTFLINAKKVDNPLFISPDIITINDSIIIRTSISDILAINKSFYISIASYEDILNNNDIYKIPFSAQQKEILITKTDANLIQDTVYCIWIEDDSFNQISNVATFIYNYNEEDTFKNYENKNIIDTIYSYAKTLPEQLQETIYSTINNNYSIYNYNLIQSVLSLLLNEPITDNTLTTFLSNFKYYLGTFGVSNLNIDKLLYDSQILTFNSLKSGSIILYSLKTNSCSFNVMDLKEGINSIDISNFGPIVLLIAYDDLYNKTKLIYINKDTNYVKEV